MHSYISRESGFNLAEAKLQHLGSATSIESTKTSTTIVGGDADYEFVDEKIDILKRMLESTGDFGACERIQHRITRLASGVAVIRVGAPTEVEMIEKKHRIEDALEAVRAAQLDGILPGGGTALVKAQTFKPHANCLALKNTIKRLALKSLKML